MHVQLSRVHKTLPALLTRVRFFTGVDALMLLEAVKPTECLPAIGTQVDLISLLKAGVVLKALDCAKALGALGAAVWLFPRENPIETQIFAAHLWVVSPDVFVKVVFTREGERAVGTEKNGVVLLRRALKERFPARVALLMALQARGLGERLKALRAAVGPLLRVDGALVAAKVTQTVEVKVTAQAAVRSTFQLNTIVGFEKINITENSFAFATNVMGIRCFLRFLRCFVGFSRTLVSFLQL